MFKSLGKYHIQKKSTYKKTLLFTTIIGSVIGAGIALFGSPTSGSQNRKLAAQKSKQVASFAKDKLVIIEQQAKKLNSSLSTELQSEIEQIATIASKLTVSGKENLSNIADKLNQAITNFRENLSNTTDVETVNKIENLGKKTAEDSQDVISETIEKVKAKK